MRLWRVLESENFETEDMGAVLGELVFFGAKYVCIDLQHVVLQDFLD